MHRIYSIRVHMCIKIINISERLAWRLYLLISLYSLSGASSNLRLLIIIYFFAIASAVRGATKKNRKKKKKTLANYAMHKSENSEPIQT